MELHHLFTKVLSEKTVEVGERAIADVIVRKLRAQGVRVSRRTQEGIAKAVHEGADSIPLPNRAVPLGTQPKIKITKADLQALKRLELQLKTAMPRIVETETTAFAQRVLKGLSKEWPGQSKHELEAVVAFQRHQERRWSKGLSGLAMTLTITRELGIKLAEQCASQPGMLPHVLVRLHARACTVTDEVITLLRAGFADAASARWRTLHELAVTSLFLRQHGESAAERFVEHEAIDSMKAARMHQKHARRLQLTRLPRREVDRLRRVVQKRIAKYGKSFGSPFGWAARGPTDYVRGFEDVEKRVSLSHWRQSYKSASHQVHASPNAMFQWIATYGHNGPLGGRSMLGLADPGQRTAISLNQVTAAVAGGKANQTFDTVVALKILTMACTKTIDDFLQAHRLQQRVVQRRSRRSHANLLDKTTSGGAEGSSLS